MATTTLAWHTANPPVNQAPNAPPRSGAVAAIYPLFFSQHGLTVAGYNGAYGHSKYKLASTIAWAWRAALYCNMLAQQGQPLPTYAAKLAKGGKGQFVATYATKAGKVHAVKVVYHKAG